MASPAIVKSFCLVLIMISIAEAAISCGSVTSSLRPCLSYLVGGNALPPACCDGVKSLNSAATTTQDRQTVCFCLKTLTKSYQHINYGKAAGLPGNCGVTIPYKIAPSTDCSQVQ